MLEKILCSHKYNHNNIKVADMVQVYLKSETDTSGVWSLPRVVLTIDFDGGFVTVPGRDGKILLQQLRTLVSSTTKITCPILCKLQTMNST